MTTLIEDSVILSPANDGGSLACKVIVCTIVQRCSVFGLEYVLAVRMFVLVVLFECCVSASTHYLELCVPLRSSVPHVRKAMYCESATASIILHAK
jgi:hypothetical protein